MFARSAWAQARPVAAFSKLDHCFMAQAVSLARRGDARCRPNPRVGCVIVRQGAVVGQGWHQYAGGPHAEVYALGEAGGLAEGATAYVTLEPCAHAGRTPPCVSALIDARVARVVVAHEDPFKAVNGRGVAQLREAGIVVECGLMREQAYEINKGFLACVTRGRPWLRVKMGMSLDGRTALADGQSRWITGNASLDDVQRWRASSAAILTAAGTVMADDPSLCVRAPAEPPVIAPVRVVLDSRLATAANARIYDSRSRTLLYHAAAPGVTRDYPPDVELIAAHGSDGRVDLEVVMADLARRGLQEVQVEAGPTLVGALLSQELVDELILYIAPVLLGASSRGLADIAAPPGLDLASRFRVVDTFRFDDDVRICLRSPASMLVGG